jgi:hypothetical protein
VDRRRAELTKLERDENIAEWIRLTEREQVVSGKLRETREGRPGIPSSVKDELGVGDDEARRAVKVDSLSPEAKAAAVLGAIRTTVRRFSSIGKYGKSYPATKLPAKKKNCP